MMIGVICTCAPFVYKMAHEHSAQIEILTSFIVSHLSFSFTKQSRRKSSFKPFSLFAYERRHKSENDAIAVQTYDEERLTYTEILDGTKNASYGLNPTVTSFHTVVAGGEGKRQEHFMNGDDGIHLKHEILQERTVAVDDVRSA